MKGRQPQGMQVEFVQLPLIQLYGFVEEIIHHHLLNKFVRILLPLHHLLLNNLDLLHLLGLYSQVLTLLHDLLESVL